MEAGKKLELLKLETFRFRILVDVNVNSIYLFKSSSKYDFIKFEGRFLGQVFYA